MGILFIQHTKSYKKSVSNYMVAAIKLFGENSIGISQSAVKAYRRMKIEVRLGKVDYIDD